MQAAIGGEPREVRFVAIKLETIGLQPFSDSAGALAHSGQERVNVTRRAGSMSPLIPNPPPRSFTACSVDVYIYYSQ